jgi:ABC-type glycerol-3-phosphate transport system substrate-binding protein
MKISLFQGILVGIFAAGGLIGLFMFATYKGGSEATISNLVVWGTLPKQDIEAGFTELAKGDTKLKAVSYVQKDPDTIVQELASSIATGNGPDLVLASQEELHGLRALVTEIPTKTLAPADYETAFIDEGTLFATPSGGHYALPFLVDPMVLFWNKDLFATANVTVPPTSWEALPGLVPVFTKRSASNQISQGLIGMGTYDNVTNARGILSTLFLQTGVPISERGVGNNYRANLGQSSSEGKTPGKSVLDYYTSFADAKTTSYTYNASLPASRDMFKNNTLGLYLGYTSDAAYLAQANPNLNFGVAPMLQPIDATVMNTYGRLYGLFISRGSANPAQAYEAAALLTNSTEQGVFAQSTGLAPAARAALAQPDDPVASNAYRAALYSQGWISPAAAGVDDVFSAMIMDVVNGRIQIDAALSRASGALSLLLQK